MRLCRSLLCLLPLLLGGWSHGTGPSTIGVNVGYPIHNPFLNALKNAGTWGTFTAGGADTGEEAYLYSFMVDSNNYPTTLAAQTQVCTGGTGGVSSTTLTITGCNAGNGLWNGGTLSGTGISGTPTLSGVGGNGVGGGAGSYTMSSAQTITNGTSITETTTFTRVISLIDWLTDSRDYSGGNWVVLFDGSGTIVAANGASVTNTCNSSCPGGAANRLIVNAPSAGWFLYVTATTVGNTVKNIRVVAACGANDPPGCVDSTSSVVGTREALMNAGEVYDPVYIAKMKPFKTFRFMDWNGVNGSTITNWANRAQNGWVHWAGANQFAVNGAIVLPQFPGLPYEPEIDLCNRLGATCWFNTPCGAQTSYATSMANLVLGRLNPGLKVILEQCNEPFLQNWGSPLHSLLQTGGFANYPSSGSNFEAEVNYVLLNHVINCAAWKTAWGSQSSRITCALSFQTGNDGGGAYNDYVTAFTDSMRGGSGTNFTGTVASHTDAAADAPYLGNFFLPLAWTADQDQGMAKLFQEMRFGGLLPTTSQNNLGNCGNGAGATCGGPTAFTFTSTLSLPATPNNQTCFGMGFNQTSSGLATLAVDGGTAFPLADQSGYPVGSGLGNFPTNVNSNHVLCFTNAVGPASGAISVVAATRANPCVLTLANNGFLEVSSQLTMSGFTDTGWTALNGNTYPITSDTYNLASHQFSINTNCSGFGAAYTSGATATGSGATSGQWRITDYGGVGGAGIIGQMVSFMNSDKTMATSKGINTLLNYEGGNQMLTINGDPVLVQWIIGNMYRDARMKEVYKQYYTSLKAISVGPLLHYHSIGAPSNFGDYGLLEYMTQPNAPEYEGLKSFH